MHFKIVISRQNFCPNQFLLQNIHKIQEIFRLIITNIINCIRWNRQTIFSIFSLRCILHYTFYTFYNIIHICEITFAISIIKNLNYLTFQQLIGKTKVSHIWTTCWSINCKETQTSRRNIIEFTVSMSQ